MGSIYMARVILDTCKSSLFPASSPLSQPRHPSNKANIVPHHVTREYRILKRERVG